MHVTVQEIISTDIFPKGPAGALALFMGADSDGGCARSECGKRLRMPRRYPLSSAVLLLALTVGLFIWSRPAPAAEIAPEAASVAEAATVMVPVPAPDEFAVSPEPERPLTVEMLREAYGERVEQMVNEMAQRILREILPGLLEEAIREELERIKHPEQPGRG